MPDFFLFQSLKNAEGPPTSSLHIKRGRGRMKEGGYEGDGGDREKNYTQAQHTILTRSNIH